MDQELLMGLLLGGFRGGYQVWQQQKAREELAQAAAGLTGLMGTRGGMEMGPPEPGTGAMGYASPSGYLGSQQGPQDRLRLAAGIMGLPGMGQQGMSLLQNEFARQQAQQQFEASEGRMGQQYAQTREDQLAAQALAQSNFERQFQRAGQQYAEGRGIDLARLGMEGQRLAMAQQQAQADASALPKPPSGYAWTRDATGAPIVAPLPGTTDYAKGVEGRASIMEGLQSVDTILDTVWGKPQKVGGQTVRVGGKGFESIGENSGVLSQAYGALRTAILKAEAAGVIDKGEREAFEERLADPTAWTSAATKGKRNAYEYVRGRLEQKMATHSQANPWLPPPPLPPGFQPIGGR